MTINYFVDKLFITIETKLFIKIGFLGIVLHSTLSRDTFLYLQLLNMMVQEDSRMN